MTKKRILIIVAIVIAVAAAIFIFAKSALGITAGNGIYYSQKNSGYYLQFKDDKTFVVAYNPKKDINYDESAVHDEKIEAYIEKSGTWEKSGSEITLKFDNVDETATLVEKDGYIYNSEQVYEGETTDSKLLSGEYIFKESLDREYVLTFKDDLTVTLKTSWGGSTTKRLKGTYTRTDDVITIRYKKSAEIPHKFIMTDKGLVEDCYMK